MDPYHHVLVGTDGSPASALALNAGARLAAAAGLPLTIVTVTGGDGDVGKEVTWAGQVTNAAAAAARGHGATDITTLQPSGHIVDVLIELAAETADTVLVLGGWGLESVAERLTGHVTHQVSHRAEVDVLIARRTDAIGWPSVGLATDGSTTATAAVRRGLALAQQAEIPARLITVADDEDAGARSLSAIVADLGLAGVDVPESDIRVESSPISGLVEASRDYGLLVVGNRNMSGAKRLLGSVANKVSHDAVCDVLLVNTTS